MESERKSNEGVTKHMESERKSNEGVAKQMESERNSNGAATGVKRSQKWNVNEM